MLVNAGRHTVDISHLKTRSVSLEMSTQDFKSALASNMEILERFNSDVSIEAVLMSKQLRWTRNIRRMDKCITRLRKRLPSCE